MQDQTTQQQPANEGQADEEQNANSRYRLDDTEDNKLKVTEEAKGGVSDEGSAKKPAAMVTVPPVVVHSKGVPQITATTLFDKDNKGGKDASNTKLIPNSRTALI